MYNNDEKCAVILAGGKGTRLRPYTIAMPKPLVPVGDYPIMEILIRQLAKYGFKRVIITVNHQADLIKTYFGIHIEYSLETKPLGTMGPLKLIDSLPDNFIITNGDILTDLDFGKFYENHVKNNRIFTISGYNRKHKVDYGVLHTDDAGVLNGPEDTYYGFDSLMMQLIGMQKKVTVDKFDGYWLDIGRPEDYQTATERFEEEKEKFL